MRQSLIIFTLILIFQSCSKNYEYEFIKEHPGSKKYIDFIKSHKEKLLEIDNNGFKLEWRLHVHCEDFEKHDGFRAKFYAFKEKTRLDVLFIDGKQWTRIFDSEQIHDFVNGQKSDEFIDRWGDEPSRHPYLEPLFANDIEYVDFEIKKIDGNQIAELRFISGEEKVTFLFENDDLEKYTVLFHRKDFRSYDKKSYGVNYRLFDKILVPEISISEIPSSGWCNGGKRFVDKDEYSIDFDWKPSRNTFEITDTISFIEKIDSLFFNSDYK